MTLFRHSGESRSPGARKAHTALALDSNFHEDSAVVISEFLLDYESGRRNVDRPQFKHMFHCGWPEPMRGRNWR